MPFRHTIFVLVVLLATLCGCEYRQTYGDITCNSSAQSISNFLLRVKVIPSKGKNSGNIKFIARTDKYPIGFQALLTNRFGQSAGCGTATTLTLKNTIDIVVSEEWAEPSIVGFFASTGEKVDVQIVDEQNNILVSYPFVITTGEQEKKLEWKLKQ